LGKKNNRVGVLVKNRKTRKQVKSEHGKLQKTSLQDIKNYLVKHNLIKVGSNAPEDVLRKLYEDSYLSGDIFNKNEEILLHNYISN
jgi:multimeric flavodoxin WrbA